MSWNFLYEVPVSSALCLLNKCLVVIKFFSFGILKAKFNDPNKDSEFDEFNNFLTLSSKINLLLSNIALVLFFNSN